MSESKTTSGMSAGSLLGIAFIILKLCHVINWSWWWVTIPFWGGFLLVLFIFVVAVVIKTLLD